MPLEHDEVLANLRSGDPARVDAGLAEVRRVAGRIGRTRAKTLEILLEAGLYDRAEAMALDFLQHDPSSITVGQVQRFRVQIQLQQEHWAEALTAARTYYNVASLKDTTDAINLIALCLMRGLPDDPSLARRFKQQQAAWAAADAHPSTSTSSPATQPAAANDLGPSVLTTIPVDDKAFAATLAALPEPINLRTYSFKGNLLLLCGHAKEARAVFEQSEALAGNQKETAQAIEDQARAIRAEHGCVGPANAFLDELRK